MVFPVLNSSQASSRLSSVIMKDLYQLEAEAPILRQTVELYKEFCVYLKTFPKKDQYLLGRRCEEYLLDFMEAVVGATSVHREEKLDLLIGASAKFEILKMLLRMARELKMIDNKKYLFLESRLQEIGKMLGGWIRSLNLKTA